jgi:integrase
MEQILRRYEDIAHLMPMPAVSFECVTDGLPPAEALDFPAVHFSAVFPHSTPEGNPSGGGKLFMLGSVRTKEKCPVCGGEFEEVRHPNRRQKILDLECAECLTNPKRYFVDARAFKDSAGSPGRIFTDINGNPFDSFDSALRTLEAMRREVDEHRFDSTRWKKDVRQKLILSEVCKGWLDSLKRANPDGDYRLHQETCLRLHVLPVLGGMDIRHIRGFDIQKLHKALLEKGRNKDGTPKEQFRHRKPGPGEGPLSENSVRDILRGFKSCLKWLQKQEVIERVPPFPSTSPVPRADVRWLNPADQASVLEHIPDYARLLIETMIETGVRPGSVIAAKVRDLEDGGIRIERAFTRKRKLKETKTGVTSWKALSSNLYARLVASTRNKLPDAWLFTNSQGGPFTTNLASEIWRDAARQANIDVCLYVSIRHSRVSQKRRDLERKMADELRQELDHTHFETTRKHYSRDERDAFRKRKDGTDVAPRPEDKQ